jgi:hypothetical protein
VEQKEWVFDMVFHVEKGQEGLKDPKTLIKAWRLAMAHKKIQAHRRKSQWFARKKGFGGVQRQERDAKGVHMEACKFAAVPRTCGGVR